MAKVSVIIPNRNRARYLRKRLRTIFNQTYQDIEILFVDDRSTDNSLEIVQEFRRDPRLRLLETETPQGAPTKLWNIGVRHARGDYVWIAEANDYAAPEFLQTLVAQLESHPTVGLAFCQSREIDKNGLTQAVSELKEGQPDAERWTQNFLNNGKNECATHMIKQNIIPTASAVVFRRAIWQRAGFADEALRSAADWMTWIKLLIVADVLYVAQPLNFFHPNARLHSLQIDNALIVRESYQVLQFILQWIDVEEKHRNEAFHACARKWALGILEGTEEKKRVTWSQHENIYRMARKIDPKTRSRFATIMLGELIRRTLRSAKNKALDLLRWIRHAFHPPIVRWTAPPEHVLRAAIFVDTFPETTHTAAIGLAAALIDQGHLVEIIASRPQTLQPPHPDIARYHLDERLIARVPLSRSAAKTLWISCRLLLGAMRRGPLFSLRALNVFRYGAQSIKLTTLRDAIPLRDDAWFHFIHCESESQGRRAMALKEMGVLKGPIWTDFSIHDIGPAPSKKQKRIRRDLLIESAGLLAPSESLKSRLIALGCNSRKVQLHPFSVDRDAFVQEAPADVNQIRILTVADLNDQTSIENAIHAFAIVLKTNPSLEYKIVGYGPLRPKVRELIRKLGIAKSVTLLADQNQSELNARIQESHLFLDATRSGGDRANEEKTALAALRAVAAGVPAICGPTPAIVSLIEGGVSGILLATPDTPQLVEKIKLFIHDLSVWRDVANLGRENVVARHDSRRLGVELANVYIEHYGS